MLDPRNNVRRPPILETGRIAAEALANDIGTVIFAQSQSNVETLFAYLAGELERRGHISSQAIPVSSIRGRSPA